MMSEPNIPNGNVGGAGDGPARAGSKKQLTLEKIYQKKSQLEHILLRPDTYIGSVQRVKEAQWLFDEEEKCMVRKEIEYVPGLYKIFDEILLNAADHKQRDNTMNMIKIEIDKEKNVISIYNNGKGIPVAEHKDEKIFIPTMIFGHLLTSSNYDDEIEKVTGGRNGYGAKLCNIFSKEFTVETANSDYKKVFKQTWKDNMTKAGGEKIKESDKNYTKITFSPDLSKFDMKELEDDIIKLMTRRAYDVAASSGVKVFLNGIHLPVKNFRDYVNLYIPKGDDAPKIVYESLDPRWEVALSTSDIGFQQISFVNSIATTKGGRHVDHVSEAIVKSIIEKAKKKIKSVIRPFLVKNNLWLFIKCLIVNPTFDSQTKENMTTQVKSFGSKCVLSEAFFKNIDKSLHLTDTVLLTAKQKDDEKLAKTSGGKMSKLKVNKLEDANFAGTKKSIECTLILTEGDSAKTLAVAGLGVLGRDNYGVFPLRGKFLNVREASSKQIMENAEICNVIKILGLKYKKSYVSEEDMRSLRYRKLMIMTDQDQDGSHIKGLLINFIHHNWPSLLKMNFLEEFITPIVKASKGKQEAVSFFSLPEFEEWKKETNDWHTYRIKYYKGLGTSTSEEAKEYFSNMERHRIKFEYSGSGDDNNITMAFSKKCVEQRKEWLTQWMESMKQRREMGLPEDYLYEKDTTKINFSDFINKELVLFSNSDNERSIPNLIDGLKPGQRKVIYTCFKRNDKKEVKVAQLAGSVAEHSAYHHGEVSLMGTIVNLAQNFVGSNNINLLQPIGQFGSRILGGKDQASPRYIFTMLSPLAKYIFHPNDEPLLTYQKDDNQKIEPIYYVPIIPMVLVNGAEGIGTGWSTKIPNYNPRDIVQNILKLIDGEEDLKPLIPWYKNFRGTIEPYSVSKYHCFGEVAVLSDSTVEITELPIGVWTDNYKTNVLDPLMGEKNAGQILSYSEYSTDKTVRFVVHMDSEKLDKAEEEGLHKFFKLQAAMNTSTMVAFDGNCVLQKFETPEAILKHFFDLRLEYYTKRKNYMEGDLQARGRKLSNQARFILEKCNGELTIENKKRIAMVHELQNKGYDPDPVRAWRLAHNKDEALAEESEEVQESQSEETGEGETEAESKIKYDYLLGMPMWSLTLEKKNDLLKKRDEALQQYDVLKKKSREDLWREDLQAFLAKLTEVEEEERKKAADVKIQPKGKKSGGSRGSKTNSSNDKNTKPDPLARRIVPKLDADSVKKLEKADKPKMKRVKKSETGEEDKDEFDDISDKPTKSLKERLGNSPDQIEKKLQAKRKNLKQSKLSSKKDSPKKRTKNSQTDSDEYSDEEVLPIQSTPPERTNARRAAASKVKYNFSEAESEEEPFSDDEEDTKIFTEPKPAIEKQPAEKPFENDEVVIRDTDSDTEPENTEPKNSGGSDAMFDIMMAGGCVKPPASKKKGPVRKPAEKSKAPSKRPKAIDDSDSDDQKAPKKGRKKSDSDDDVFEVEAHEPKTTGRKRRIVQKTYKESDESDEDFC